MIGYAENISLSGGKISKNQPSGYKFLQLYKGLSGMFDQANKQKDKQQISEWSAAWKDTSGYFEVLKKKAKKGHVPEKVIKMLDSLFSKIP